MREELDRVVEDVERSQREMKEITPRVDKTADRHSLSVPHARLASWHRYSVACSGLAVMARAALTTPHSMREELDRVVEDVERSQREMKEITPRVDKTATP